MTSFALIANDTAAHFFLRTTEHRDVKLLGLSYEHDSAGNALAALVKPGCIEFRFHRKFSNARVRAIAKRICSHPDAAFALSFAVTYQGRLLTAAA